MKDELKSIVSWLNYHYNQNSENYDIFVGSKPGIIKYNEHTAISPWACGAIVCIYDQLYFIQEDDGNWFLNEYNSEYDYIVGLQDSFSIGWIESFISALDKLKEYVKENGMPVYFSGTNVLCHYRL